MAKNHIICGLDIGTSAIKALAVGRKSDSETLEVLGQVSVPSFGVRRGVVVKIDETASKITEVLKQLEEEIGQKIENVYVNVGGSHLFSTPSHGTVIVSRADQRISEEDVHRVIQAAQVFSLPSNKEILDIFPREFIIDNQGQIKEPLDMRGLKLEVDVLALCAFSPYLKNLTSVVLNAGFQISDIIPSSLASARAVLTPRQKELGVCLVDIGGGTTNIAVYEEGDLAHVAVLPIGSERITNDLAIGLRTDVELAEQIKKEFGSCVAKGGNKKEKIKLSGNTGESGEVLTFSHKMLAKIIEARVGEIFNLVQQELKKVPLKSVLPAGIVLTGGGAKLPKIIELAKKELKLPVRIGLAKGLSGLEEDPCWSTAAGLVLGVKDSSGGEGKKAAVLSKGAAGGLKKIFKVFLP